MHALRCVPSSGHPLLYEFDNLLREGISAFTNSLLSDLQWLQASLPITEEGLMLLLRPQRFSRTSSCNRSQRSLTIGLYMLVQVGPNCTQLIAPEDSSIKQRTWDAPAVTRDWHCIWNHATCDLDKARLMVIKSPHSSDWLFALPVSACGHRLSDEAIRIAVRLRLGLNLCEPHI